MAEGLNTYSDLQTAVLDWLARPGDALVMPAVPTMIRLFEAEASRRLKVGAAEKFAIVTIAAGTSYVDLPADFGELRRASIGGMTLTLVSPSSLPGLTGIPFAYAIWGQSELWLGPQPDALTDIEILYQAGVPPLTNTNPTNWLLAQAPDAYLFGVLVEAELYVGHDERVRIWAERREAAFASIELADRKARWGGSLQIQVDGITLPPGGATRGGGSAMSAVFVGSRPPSTPNSGELYWDSVGGQLYVWYIDPSGAPGQWVAATNQPVVGPGTGPGSIETVFPTSGAVVTTKRRRAATPRAPGDPVEVSAETPSVYIASAPLDALTVRLLPNPQTGDTVQLCFSGPVTALTIEDAAAGAVMGAPTNAYGPGAALIFRYTTPPGAWIYWK